MVELEHFDSQIKVEEVFQFKPTSGKGWWDGESVVKKRRFGQGVAVAIADVSGHQRLHKYGLQVHYSWFG